MNFIQEADELKAIDLFSGAGGLTLGLKMAGFKVIGAVEIDRLAAKTYERNHPEVHLWRRNVLNLSAKRIAAKLGLQEGELDLLAGCPPCQGFSTLRTLNGARQVTDARNDLVYRFYYYIQRLKPKVAMLENTPGLGKDIRMFKLKKKLRRLGYRYRVSILNAADYGVPQRRKRVLLIASRIGVIGFAKPDRESPTVREIIGQLPPAGASGDPLHDLPERHSEEVLAKFALIPHDGGSRNALPDEDQLICHRTFNGFKDVYGRMSWDDVAPTITSGCFNPSKGRFLHPVEDRAITLREAALLQGFPLNYYFSLEKGKCATACMIGNALPPEFIRRHAAKVLKHVIKQRG